MYPMEPSIEEANRFPLENRVPTKVASDGFSPSWCSDYTVSLLSGGSKSSRRSSAWTERICSEELQR